MNPYKLHYVGLYENDIQIIIDSLRDSAAFMAAGTSHTDRRALKEARKALEDLAFSLNKYLSPETNQSYGAGGFTY